MAQVTNQADIQAFQNKAAAYKKAIDASITAYSKQVEKTTLQQYGTYSRLASDAYLSILGRGGKRIRGALVCLGYEMSGGQDRAMALVAAQAIEMLQAYILIIDDFQDRSQTRRGGPTAHVLLGDYHRRHHLADDSEHFGASIAINAALGGAHAAQMLLANLDAPEDLRLKVLSIVNRTMIVTAHGQTNDIVNEVIDNVNETDIERVMEWKTAHYSLLNPLHVGMVLAGADCAATDAITDYAMHAGKAFQITDDILGIFGTEQESGKSPGEDIREGKRTLLTLYALEHTDAADKNFLLHMLGNGGLSPAEFRRCQDVLTQSGALDYARHQAQSHVASSLEALAATDIAWSPSGVQFLRGLAWYLLTRQS